MIRKLLSPLAEECASLPLEPARRSYFERAVPIYDSLRDNIVKNLGSFESARAGLAAVDRIQTQYGQNEAVRIALKFAFEILASGSAEAAIEPVFARLIQEIEEPNWQWYGVANLRNVEGDNLTYQFDEGTKIQGRDPSVFEALGIPHATAPIEEEWREGSFGSYVLIVRSLVPKTAGNTVFTPDLWLHVQRALLALRLAAAGDVTIGHLFFFRSTPIEFSLGGVTSSASALSPAPEAR